MSRTGVRTDPPEPQGRRRARHASLLFFTSCLRQTIAMAQDPDSALAYSSGRTSPVENRLAAAGWLAGEADPDLLRDLLHRVIDPELGVNIIDLGLVYDIQVNEGRAVIRMTLTTPGCPLGAYLDDAVHDCLWGAPGVDSIDVELVWQPPWQPGMMSALAKRQLGWRG